MIKDTQFTINHQLTKRLASYFAMPTHYPTHRWSAPNSLIPYSLEAVGDMKRILILGSSGSGKSTLARRLGATLELPVIHLDRHFWKPGWTPTPKSEWIETVKQLSQRPQWIIDGNYRSTLDIRLQVADTVIFLDLPPWLCAYRATKRRIRYANSTRPDIAKGCREKLFDPQFPEFIRHIWAYPDRARPDIRQRLGQNSIEKKIVWLKTTGEVTEFLNDPKNPKFFNTFSYNGHQNGSHTEQITPSSQIFKKSS